MQFEEETTGEMAKVRHSSGVSNPSATRHADTGTADTSPSEPVANETYTAEEQALVEERLKNLGYL